MKIAYVHVLPVEYYPPAMNTLSLLASQPGWDVRAWTSYNDRGLPEWNDPRLTIRRSTHGNSRAGVLGRMAGYSRWHLSTALEMKRWEPDAVIAVEPQSMPALTFYYSVLRGEAPLFIHHHEYYSPHDYDQPGMRLVRMARKIDNESLLRRAEWVSQTNPTRLRMMLETHRSIRADATRVLPNYPPAEWVERARTAARVNPSEKTRLIYVGSASLEDTFIHEIAAWVNGREEYSLHVVGNNVRQDVWEILDSLDAPNITTDRKGVSYGSLPELLCDFDVGLILYKGNTTNFVYNVPNKAIEYLAAGLEVWYPPEMKGMEDFKTGNPAQRLQQVNFKSLAQFTPQRIRREAIHDFPFNNETALQPLIDQLSQIRGSSE